MKLNRLLITLLTLAVASTNSFSDEIKLGYRGLSMDYVESDTSGSFLDSEKSGLFDIWGLDASYKSSFAGFSDGDNTNLYLMLSYVKGKSNYDGALQDLTTGAKTPYTSQTNNTILNGKLRFEEVRHTPELDAKIFLDVGYRKWDRDLDSGGQYGFLEEYKWLYGAVGIGADWFENSSVLGFSGSFQYAYNPTMDAHLNGKTSFDLGQTYGFNAEVHFRQYIATNYFLEAGYEYDFWEIGKSNTVNNFLEPDSKTKNQSIIFSVGFVW